MIRILHITATVDPASGGPIEGIVRQNEVTRDSVHREVVTLDHPSAPFLGAFPMKVHPMGASAKLGGNILSRYGYTPKLVPWLRANIDQYDFVIVNGLWNFAPLAASMVLPGSRVPYFVFTHGMMDPWFRKAYPIKHLAKQALWLVSEGKLMRSARGVLFTSEEEKIQARNMFWGHPYNEVVVGYGAVDPIASRDDDASAFPKAFGLDGKKYLLFLSRIHPKKGCDLLVSAFAALAKDNPELDLVVAGPDQTGLTKKLAEIAAKTGVSNRVHFTGPLYGELKWSALRSADAFALPSHQENFGIAVAEALACGTPVLISDKVNIWREIDAANAGLIAADDLEGAKQLVANWINLPAESKSRMRKNAREVFEKKFNVLNTAPDLIKTISQLSA